MSRAAPRYRVEYQDNAPPIRVEIETTTGRHKVPDLKVAKVFEWPPSWGPPTAATLNAWRELFDLSFAPGGMNETLSKVLGVTLAIRWARIVQVETGEVVAEIGQPHA
jgi:hypothetical protein